MSEFAWDTFHGVEHVFDFLTAVELLCAEVSDAGGGV